jgi:hypothetical protein
MKEAANLLFQDGFSLGLFQKVELRFLFATLFNIRGGFSAEDVQNDRKFVLMDSSG